MNIFRYAFIGCLIALGGCASTGGNHGANNAKLVHKNYSTVWERIRDGYGMPELNDSKVDYWVNYYRNRPGTVENMAEHSRKYIHYVTTELEKRNMPTELALLPFVESAYKPTAYSKSKAAGLWQFIPSTGTEYNLTQDWWRDDRRDPVHATQAAINYLSYLHDFQDGDWFLALASYNWGQNAVKRARESNAARGLGTDFLSLKLPNETRNYVPKLIALKQIITNPSQYGINIPAIPDKPFFEEVPGGKDMDVAVVAKLAGMSEKEFKELNSASTRPVLLANQKHFLLPKSRVAQFKKNLANYQGELSSWLAYNPTYGESLSSIAQRYGISLAQLKTLNGYSPRQNVAISQRALLLPKTPEGLAAPAANAVTAPVAALPDAMLALNTSSIKAKSAPSPVAESRPVLASKASAVSSRDTHLAVPTAAPALAQRAPSPEPEAATPDPMASLIAANNAAQAAEVRQVAYSPENTHMSAVRSAVYSPSDRAVATSHVVQAGDTLYSLAKRYNTTVENISALNNLGASGLKAGMTLRLPGSGVKG
ncbi:lytic transglycosylase [Brackiella oedipodis]|uniref:lytic transglycosylase n=1 Tax=Brackiella oedipodis TaxID=124225 RepID=UPI0004905713|nr:LysM peptidoglycan-binding domain-containing protein [Brackiella oedipodis]